MKLCIIEEIYAIRADGQVIVFKMLGNDYWGSPTDAVVRCAGYSEPVPAYNLGPDMRVWLDTEALSREGIFQANCVLDEPESN